MKKTSLHPKHIELGAKMVPFAGYEMPVYYSGIVDEHLAVRNKAGIFDVSHMGEFFIRGPKARDLIQYVSANDADKLSPGKVQYSYLPNDKGGIVDDCIIYQTGNEEFMLVANAANIEKDKDWILQHNKNFNAEFEDASDQYSLLAIQGPEAVNILQKLTDEDLKSMKNFTFVNGSIAGVQDVIISATGYTGSPGFELYCKNEDAPKIWDAIFEKGKSFDLMPAGLGARDTLRLEAGLLLYGNEMDDNTSPYSVRLGWVTKLEKEFIGRDIIKKQKEDGVEEKLIGLESEEKFVPRHGYPVLDENDNQIGVITSGTRSPYLEKAIAMALIKKELATPGKLVYVQVRKRRIETKLAKLPFFK